MTLLTRRLRRPGPDGKPVVSYGYRFWHGGHLYQAYTGHTRGLAVEAEKRKRAEVELAAWEGEYGPLAPRLTPWADAVTKYQAAKADKRSLADDVRRLTWWGTCLDGQGAHYLQAVTADAVDAGKAQLTAAGHAPASVFQYLAVLRTLCNLAVRRWRLLRRNPLEQIDWPKIVRVDPVLPTRAQLDALIAQADPVLRGLILTAVQTGLRRSAIVALTEDDLTARPGMLRCQDQKGGKPMLLPVSPSLLKYLGGLVKEGRVFPGGYPRERWEALRAAVGLPDMRFHDLRHLAGTLLAEAGVQERVIQRFLGHSTVTMTERYTHPRGPALREAAGILQGAVRTRKRTPVPKKPLESA